MLINFFFSNYDFVIILPTNATKHFSPKSSRAMVQCSRGSINEQMKAEL